jgi:N6-adenosine-specific RNA methylase IME4
MNFPDKKYNIIYADPAWTYDKSGGIKSARGLAKKGTLKRQRKDLKNVLFSPQRKHSQKPDEMRDLILEHIGDLPRIELFARERINGWDSWGNEL